MRGPQHTPKRSGHAWISMIVAPAVVVGLAAIGFAAPANAVDGDPADSSTPAATSTPADASTPTATPTQTADAPTAPAADAPTSLETDAPAPPVSDTPAPPASDTPAAPASDAPVTPPVSTKSATTTTTLAQPAPMLAQSPAPDAVDPTVTVRKTWVNGLEGDQYGLAVDYDFFHAQAAVSTSNGFAGSWTDTGDTATLSVPAGKSVVVAEFPLFWHHNDGDYEQSLSCPGVQQFLGFFTMPTTNVVCTFTNTRDVASHTVTLQKTWVNGVDGDSMALTAQSEDGNISNTATSTSGGQPGPWTDSANIATIEMPVGYGVNVSENPAAPLNGVYPDPLVTCDGAALDGAHFEMPDRDVSCTVTNTAAQSTVTLQKEWVAGVAGDTAALSINGGDTVTSTSDGDRGAVTDTTHLATATVSQGSVVTVAEMLGEGNAGTYDSSVTCTGDAAPDASGTFRMPQGDVTCTYENRAHQHTLRLQKEWVNGVEGDQATITIDNAGFMAPTASTSNGQTGSWTDTDHAVQIPASAGSAVSLSEMLGDTSGTYGSSLSCDGAEPDADGTFVMPDAAVTCTLTNTAVRTVILQKQWVNGTDGDTADLSINDGDPVVSTSNGAKGSWLDTANVDMVEVPVGSAVSVAELVGESNKGTYERPALTCDGGVVPEGGSFTMPVADVTCTFTNKAVSVTPVIPVHPVKPAAVIGLANTGSDPMGPFAIGGLLAALGALLALGTWWRRRASRTE